MKHSYGSYSLIIAAGLLLVGLVFGVNALAADQNPCSEDIAKFCKDVKPGRIAMMECLEQHESQLSDACRDYEAKIENPRMESRERGTQQKKVNQACKNDVVKFCSDVKPEGGGIASCLNAHADELSSPCKDALRAAGAERTVK
jgi:hypothetical protein